MNFTPIQSRAAMAGPTQNYTEPLRVQYNNSGEQALARAGEGMAGALDKGYQQMQEMYDTGKVMEANNEYNRLMTEGTAELMQKKQENALNVVADYDKLHVKSLEKVRKKYGQFINYGKAGQAFNIYTERDNNTRRANMMKYQAAETDAYHETQFQNQLASCQQMVLDGGGSDEAIEAGCNRSNGFIEMRYVQYGKEMIEYKKREVKGQMVASALSLAVGTGDYVRMGELSTKYNDLLDPKTRVSVLSMLGKRQKEAHEKALAAEMRRDLGRFATREEKKEWVKNRMNQEGTLQSFYDIANSFCGVEMENGRNGCVEFVMKCLSKLTSFGAHNSNERNVGNLFRAASAPNSGASVMRYHGQNLNAGDIIVYATPGDDISNPDNLEHVTVADGNGGYYGNSSGARDYEDENGNRVRGNGCGVHSDSQDIGGYEIAYIIRPDDMKTQEMTDFDIDEMTDKIDAFNEKEERQIRAAENRLIEQGHIEQQDLINKGIEDPDAYDAIANKYGIIDGVVNERVLVTLQKQGSHIRNVLSKAAERDAQRASGSGGSGKKENDPMARVAIKEMLEQGIPLEEVLEHIDEHNYSNAKDLVKMAFNYTQGKGEFAVNWNPLKSKMKAQFKGDNFEAEWALAEDYAYEQYKQYQSDTGQTPTQKEMEKWLFDGFTHPEYTTDVGKFWDSTEQSPLSKAEWLNRGVSDEFYNPQTKRYSVTLTSGGTYELTPEQYKQIVEEGERADVVLFGGN